MVSTGVKAVHLSLSVNTCNVISSSKETMLVQNHTKSTTNIANMVKLTLYFLK